MSNKNLSFDIDNKKTKKNAKNFATNINVQIIVNLI